jgi:importin-4
VMGDIISGTRSQFLPHLESTIKTVYDLAEHSYEGVRKGAITTLWRTYVTLWELAEEGGMAKWTPGIPLQQQPSEDLQKLGDLVMTKTLDVWEEEMDR